MSLCKLRGHFSVASSIARPLAIGIDFNIEMAEKIIRQLSILGAVQISSRQLQKEIKSKSKSDFSDCLYFLEKYGVIGRDKKEWIRGQKVPVTLSKIGEQILKFGIIRIYLDYLHNKKYSSKTVIKKSTNSRIKKAIKNRQEEYLLKAIHFLITARYVRSILRQSCRSIKRRTRTWIFWMG